MKEPTDSIPVNHPQVVRIALRALIFRARKANLLAPLPALFICWIVWDKVPGQVIALWLVVNAIPDLVSLLLCTYLIRKPPPDHRLIFWHRWQIAIRAVQGLSWGSTAVFFHVPGPEAFTNDLSILVVLLGTAAIGTINMAPSMLTQASFTIGILGVPLVAYLGFGDMSHLKFAVGIAIGMLILLQFGYDASRQYQEGVRELVRNQQLSQTLADLSATDALTGIANRRRFDEAFGIEWARAVRHGGKVAIIMADVDLFKKYNDQYGHQAGDECLVKVAKVLSDNTQRPFELAARYGGEEFVILLPQCDLQEAAKTAEKIRVGIESLGLPHEQSPLGFVSASFGVAANAPELCATPDALLHVADTALYQAKHAGRNRVVCSNGLVHMEEGLSV
jgi:diguanylate cyclase (GGDEF)-like protein